MANIASVLKSEIARVARKEVRAEIESLKKASNQHRSTIAQLRRQLADLQRQLKQASRQVARASSSPSGTDAEGTAADGTPRRFSAIRLAAHRAKLGLSAADYGRLVGMSGATIYNWEQGKSRPNAEQLQRLVAARALGKRTVQEQLAQVAGDPSS
jgi:DNA-binding transcriptional regulator YiaG